MLTMARVVHLYRPCIVWKTDLPRNDGDYYRVSPVLRLHDYEWGLTLNRNWNKLQEEETWSLYLRKFQSADEEPKSVLVSIYMGWRNKLNSMDALTCTFRDSSSKLILLFDTPLLREKFPYIFGYDEESRSDLTIEKLTFKCFLEVDKKSEEQVTQPRADLLEKEVQEVHLYSPCIVWKTDLPRNDGDNYRESPVLRLHDYEWCLTLKRNWNKLLEEETWSLYLRKLQPPDEEPKRAPVSIYMGYRKKLKWMDALTCTFRDSSSELILGFGTSLLREEFPNILSSDEERRSGSTKEKLTFRCYFKVDEKCEEQVTQPRADLLEKEVQEGNKSLESFALYFQEALAKCEESSKGDGRNNPSYISLQEAFVSGSEEAAAISETNIKAEKMDVDRL